MENTLRSKHEQMTLQEVENLMSGKYGFLCQYDRKTGKDSVWSLIYDCSTKSMYRVEGNPSRKPYKKDQRFTIL